METDVKHIISVQDLLLWGNKNEEFCKEAGKKHPKIKLLRHIDKRTKVIDGVTTDKSLYYLYREEQKLFEKYQINNPAIKTIGSKLKIRLAQLKLLGTMALFLLLIIPL